MICARLLLALMALLAMLPIPALADDHGRIGLAAPLTGSYALIGRQLEEGLRAFAASAGMEGIESADTECTAEGGSSAAQALGGSASDVIIGLVCVDALDTAKREPSLAGKTIIVPATLQVPDAPADIGKTKATVVRFGPSPEDEFATLANWIAENWRNANFAIIDDGTLYGRQLADSVRLRLAEVQMTPVFNDTYRPRLTNQFALVRRLQRAGVDHLIIGGEAYDAAVMAANGAEIGYRLPIAGGSALKAPVEDGILPDGTVIADLVNPNDMPGRNAFQSAMDAAGVIPEGYHVWGYASGEIAKEILEKGSVSGRTVQTVFGPVSFDENGDLRTNLFIMKRVTNGQAVALVPAETNG